MGVFGTSYKIIKGSHCSWPEAQITIDPKPNGTLMIAAPVNQTWGFLDAPDNGTATWLGGTMTGTKDKLDVYGSRVEVGGATKRFQYIIGMRRVAEGAPDDQVVEWVAEDQG